MSDRLLVFCLNNGFTMLDLRQNVFDCFGPHERLGVLVRESSELVDGCDQFRHALEDAASDALPRDLPEPSFDQIQPRGTRWGNVQVESWMLLQPRLHLGVVVCPVVVQDQVEGHPMRRVSVNGAQELQKLLVAVPRVTGADHGAVQHIERREQTGGPVALVVVRHGAAAPLLHRQARLRPVQRLHLRFFIHAEHQRLVRRVEVDAEHVRQRLDKPLVGRQLEGFAPVRFQAVRVPDSRHADMADPLRVRHRPRAPVGRVGRRGLQGGLHDGPDFPGRQALGTGTMRGILGQTRRSRLGEPIPPQPHGRTRGFQALGNGGSGNPLGRQQANPRPQDDPLGGGLRPNPRAQRLFLFDRHTQRVGGSPHTVDATRPDQHCKDITDTLH